MSNQRRKRQTKLKQKQKRKEQMKMKRNMIFIDNNGTDIISTNYWHTKYGKKNFMYMSFKDGVFRLLVPDKLTPTINSCQSMELCTVSYGKLMGTIKDMMYEVNFNGQILLNVSLQHTNNMPSKLSHGNHFKLSVWDSKCNKLLERKCIFQVVGSVPTILDDLDNLDDLSFVALEE